MLNMSLKDYYDARKYHWRFEKELLRYERIANCGTFKEGTIYVNFKLCVLRYLRFIFFITRSCINI